jgi:hypothetical protein
VYQYVDLRMNNFGLFPDFSTQEQKNHTNAHHKIVTVDFLLSYDVEIGGFLCLNDRDLVLLM